MDIFFLAVLALCDGNPRVTVDTSGPLFGEYTSFPSQRTDNIELWYYRLLLAWTNFFISRIAFGWLKYLVFLFPIGAILTLCNSTTSFYTSLLLSTYYSVRSAGSTWVDTYTWHQNRSCSELYIGFRPNRVHVSCRDHRRRLEKTRQYVISSNLFMPYLLFGEVLVNQTLTVGCYQRLNGVTLHQFEHGMNMIYNTWVTC